MVGGGGARAGKWRTYLRTCWDMFGYVQASLGVCMFVCVWPCLDMFGRVRLCMGMFEYV